MRGLRDDWQFLHSLTIPELIVATVEIIVIKTVESFTVGLSERLISIIELRGDARMELLRILMVAHEKHSRNE